MAIGKETWDKEKLWKVESLYYYDETARRWKGVTIGRTEFLSTEIMRKMIKEVKGDE